MFIELNHFMQGDALFNTDKIKMISLANTQGCDKPVFRIEFTDSTGCDIINTYEEIFSAVNDAQICARTVLTPDEN